MCELIALDLLYKQQEMKKVTDLFSSNEKQNIDPAFIRRVRNVFESPRPDLNCESY